MPEIEHIVVLIMENHSFDNLLGMVPGQVPGRGSVDGWKLRHGRPVNANPSTSGKPVTAQHAASPCQLIGKPSQTWDASHEAWDAGRNDGFVRASGPVAMRFWDRDDIPFTYSLAEHFPIGERYFQDLPSLAIVPGAVTLARTPRIRTFDHFLPDVADGRLPQFTFIDPNYATTSEEDPQDIQVGERFIAEVAHALMAAPTWKRTALFLTYDEHGGYYDHVPPPPAIAPDSIAPMLTAGDVPGAFDRYGFRVPLIVVSPWARPGYVSRLTQDHTSITAFIERKWNLPAMTFRDANAHPMTDYFDFRRAAFETPPQLAAAPKLGPGLAECLAAGLSPPMSGSGGPS